LTAVLISPKPWTCLQAARANKELAIMRSRAKAEAVRGDGLACKLAMLEGMIYGYQAKLMSAQDRKAFLVSNPLLRH
jgi:hypothetical protein